MAEPCTAQGVGKGSLTSADGRLYTLSERFVMGLVAADPEDFEVVSQFELPIKGDGPSWAYPVVCGGRLYLRHDNYLFCYDVRARSGPRMGPEPTDPRHPRLPRVSLLMKELFRACTFPCPPGYHPLLDPKDTEKAIRLIKEFFQTNLAFELNLIRVTAPLIVEAGTGINDDLNGVERPVTFPVRSAANIEVQIVQSLAKWKRMALADWGSRWARVCTRT